MVGHGPCVAQGAAGGGPLEVARVGAFELGLGGRGERGEAAGHAGGHLGEQRLSRSDEIVIRVSAPALWGRVR